MKSFIKDSLFYAVTSIRQYENASIVNLTVHQGTIYRTQARDGGGFDGHIVFQFLVAPPLKEGLVGVKLLSSDFQKDGLSFENELNA